MTWADSLCVSFKAYAFGRRIAPLYFVFAQRRRKFKMRWAVPRSGSKRMGRYYFWTGFEVPNGILAVFEGLVNWFGSSIAVNVLKGWQCRPL